MFFIKKPALLSQNKLLYRFFALLELVLVVVKQFQVLCNAFLFYDLRLNLNLNEGLQGVTKLLAGLGSITTVSLLLVFWQRKE